MHCISALPTSCCKKFAFRWHGPFCILELKGVNAIIWPCHKPHQASETVHINKLKPCYFQDTPEPDSAALKPQDTDTDNESDSANKPLIQYALQAKKATVQTSIMPEQKKQVKGLIQQQTAQPNNLRSQKI